MSGKVQVWIRCAVLRDIPPSRKSFPSVMQTSFAISPPPTIHLTHNSGRTDVPSEPQVHPTEQTHTRGLASGAQALMFE